MKKLFWFFVASWLAGSAFAADVSISAFTRHGDLTWTNVFTNGICTIESAVSVPGPWQPQKNFYTTSSVGQASVPVSSSNRFYRLLSVDISTNSPNGFSNLLHSYGNIHTIAGKGQFGGDVTNYWQPSFEGGFATNANLSRPHFAMADNAGNIFIADKDSHSILKMTPDGRIHTAVGTHAAGDGTNAFDYGTNVALNFPNGLWVRGDGTVYILDTGNGKVRRLDTNGLVTTLFTVTTGISSGRGLWVKDDESVVYFCSGTELKKRVPGNVSTLNSNFKDLGNIVVDARGDIIATDRGDHKVYRVDATGGAVGGRTRIAGNGSTNAVVDGTLALTNGLFEVRGVWLLPNGGYLLATHAGSQILYVDPAGILHVFVDGQSGGAHSGDGQWFHSPGFKVSEIRSITMDSQGHLLITENDHGYIRRIDFLRLQP